MRGKLTSLDLWNLLTTDSPLLHDLIISPHVKHSPINLPKKIYFPMQSFLLLYKNVSPYFVGERGDYALSSYLFTFLRDHTLTFAVQIMTFQAKLPSHCF